MLHLQVNNDSGLPCEWVQSTHDMSKVACICRHAQRLLKYGFVLGPQANSDSNLPPDEADSVPATFRRNAPSNVILNIADLRNTMNEAAAEEQEEEAAQDEHPGLIDGIGQQQLAHDAVMSHDENDSSRGFGADYHQHNQPAMHQQPDSNQFDNRHQLALLGRGLQPGMHAEDEQSDVTDADHHFHQGHMPLNQSSSHPAAGTLSQQQQRQQLQHFPDEQHPDTSNTQMPRLTQTSHLGQDLPMQSLSTEDANANTGVASEQGVSADSQGMMFSLPQGMINDGQGAACLSADGSTTQEQMQELSTRFARHRSAVRGSRSRIQLASVRFAEDSDQTV